MPTAEIPEITDGIITIPFQSPAAAYAQLSTAWWKFGYLDFAPDAIARGTALDPGIVISLTAMRSVVTFCTWAAQNGLGEGLSIEVNGLLSPPGPQIEPQVFTESVIGYCLACRNPVIDVRPYPELAGIGTVRVDGAFCCSGWEGEYDDEASALRQCEITRARIIKDAQPKPVSVYATEPVVKRLAETVRAFLDGRLDGSPTERVATLEAAWNVCVTEHPWW